jgi:hypothetical protein
MCKSLVKVFFHIFFSTFFPDLARENTVKDSHVD